MKVNDLMQGRNQGLVLALDIVRKGGIEALEKEIKYRNISGVSTTLSKTEVEQAVHKMEFHATQMAIAVSLITLADEFGMGKMQAKKFKETFDKKVEDVCRNNGDTTEMIERIRDELGLRITFD